MLTKEINYNKIQIWKIKQNIIWRVTMEILKMKKLSSYLWLVFGIIGGLGFLGVWFLLPHKAPIDHIWQLIFKLTAFLFIVLAISFFPVKSKYGHLLLILPFFVYAGYIFPRIGYYGMMGAVVTSNYALAGDFYTLVYLLTFPSIILITCLAYRIGGGTSGNVIKIALSAQIILFSGLLDFMWFLINPVQLPDVIEYAHHIKLILGHYPKYNEAIIFAICHIPLLVIAILLPFDKWINKLFGINIHKKQEVIQHEAESV